jgi:hypothetical protein
VGDRLRVMVEGLAESATLCRGASGPSHSVNRSEYTGMDADIFCEMAVGRTEFGV